VENYFSVFRCLQQKREKKFQNFTQETLITTDKSDIVNGDATALKSFCNIANYQLPVNFTLCFLLFCHQRTRKMFFSLIKHTAYPEWLINFSFNSNNVDRWWERVKH
jgi:hypothetical protein